MAMSQVRPVRSSRKLKEPATLYGFGVFVACLILAIAYQFVAPAPPKTLTIATAATDGAYFAFGQQYRQLFAQQNIDLRVLATSGSLENLQLLAEHKAEVAFLQGGVAEAEDYPEIMGLASLYLEPLWIFVNKDLHVTRMQDLVGRRIAIGPEGSGTRKMAGQLFSDNNMAGRADTTLLPLAGREGARELLAGRIDALFLVTRASTPLIHELSCDPRVALVSLARAESYARLHHYLSHIVLPQGVLDMARNVPAHDTHLIAPAATLVASKQLHPALVDLLMQVAATVHEDNTIFGEGRQFPSPENVDFPLSKEALRYYRNGPPLLQRYLPFWAASLIDRLKVMLLPLVALILPLGKVLPPTYRWRMRSRIYRWYDELHELDLQTREDEGAANLTAALASLDTMEEEVRQIVVPLAYSEELYNLRLHIELLRNQVLRLSDSPGSRVAD